MSRFKFSTEDHQGMYDYLDDWSTKMYVSVCRRDEGKINAGRYKPKRYYSDTGMRYHDVPDTLVLMVLGKAEIN